MLEPDHDKDVNAWYEEGMRMQAEDSYYMNVLASHLEECYTCLRPPRPSAAVLVVDSQNYAAVFGYVRPGDNSPTCKDLGECMMVDGHCVRNVHAEVNAIVTAARLGYATGNSVLYSWNKPCYNCTITAIQAGVVRIVYRYAVYDEERTKQAIKLAGIICEQCTGFIGE